MHYPKTALLLSCVVGLSLTPARAITLGFTLDPASMWGYYFGSIQVTGDLSKSENLFASGGVSVALSGLSEFTSASGQELYVFGSIGYQTPMIGGGSGGIFLAGAPNSALSQFSGSESSFDGTYVTTQSASWYVPMIWDGSQFAGTGSWSVAWTSTLANPVPDDTNTTLLILFPLLAGALYRTRAVFRGRRFWIQQSRAAWQSENVRVRLIDLSASTD